VKRTLHLTKEVLTELATDDLRGVVGGYALTRDAKCVQLSLDPTCGRPTCGRNCTGTSDPLTK
jgi:hypothetical protein